MPQQTRDISALSLNLYTRLCTAPDTMFDDVIDVLIFKGQFLCLYVIDHTGRGAAASRTGQF